MGKIIILITLSLTILFGGLYDYEYDPKGIKTTKYSKLNDNLMYGDFESIIRFEPLFVDTIDGVVASESKEELKKILDTIKQYKNKKIIVTIIGYTNSIKTHNKLLLEGVVFDKNNTDKQIKKPTIAQSLKYANSIKQYLIDNQIKENILFTQSRGAAEQLFTQAISLGKYLNNRVMVTIYEPFVKKVQKKEKKIVKPVLKNINLQINYSNNSSIISKQDINKVKEFAQVLKMHPLYKAKIVGYTSSLGSLKYNQILSYKRAKGVVDMLISFGISKDRLTAIGKGELNPIATNKTKKGQLLNRRIIAELYTK